MGNNSGKIEKKGGINLVDDLYVPFGVAIPSKGPSIVHICCNEHGKLNKWARNKPVRSSLCRELTEDERKGINYGFTCGDPLLDPTQLTPGMWQCLYPRPGNTDEVKRLSDFVGYNHNATPPMVPPGDVMFSAFSSTHTFSTTSTSPVSSDSISHDDISFLQKLYPCVVITGGNITGYNWKTSGKMFSEHNATVELSRAEVSNWVALGKPLMYLQCFATSKRESFSEFEVIGTKFYPMMSDEPVAGNIEINSSPLLVKTLGVLGNTNINTGTNLTFYNAGEYTGLLSTGKNHYLAAGTSGASRGTVALLVDITNRSASPATINQAALTAGMTPTLVGDSSGSGRPVAIFGVSGESLACTVGAALTSMTVASRSTQRAIFVFEGIAATVSGVTQSTIPESAKEACRLSLYYRGDFFLSEWIKLCGGTVNRYE